MFSNTLELPAKMESLERSIAFVCDRAKKEGFSRRRILDVELVTEEALSNICHYAYPREPKGDMEISCCFNEKVGLIIQITDAGLPFDIQDVPEPDLISDLRSRQPGGLGVFLIRAMADAVLYCRRNNRNVLTLIMKREKDKKS